jgi:hypothetical protein
MSSRVLEHVSNPSLYDYMLDDEEINGHHGFDTLDHQVVLLIDCEIDR